MSAFSPLLTFAGGYSPDEKKMFAVSPTSEKFEQLYLHPICHPPDWLKCH